MSKNNNNMLLDMNEYILLHRGNVNIKFSGKNDNLFSGSKQGHVYLTSHRMIFKTKNSEEIKPSFSAPFVAMSDVEIKQPVLGANYIKGKVRIHVDEIKFKLYFNSGGAIQFAQALLQAVKIPRQDNFHCGDLAVDVPPSYELLNACHKAPPPAYKPPPGYYD